MEGIAKLVGRGTIGLQFAALFCCLALVLSLICTPAWASAAFYAGGYNGSGPASGMAMILEQNDNKIFGRLVDGQNNVFQLNGEVSGRTASGTLQNEKANASFELEMRPSGVKFVFIPFTADGRPNHSGRKHYTFARGRVAHPSLADYRVPAPKSGDSVDVILFLENYRGWSDEEVAIAYDGVPEADRSLIRLFDHLQADMMLRLCRAEAEQKYLDEVFDGQPIDCAGLVALADLAESKGVIREFYDATEFQRGALYTTFACNRDIYPPNRCMTVDKMASRAAMTWKNAKVIFTSLNEKETRMAEVLGLNEKLRKKPSREEPKDTAPTEVAEDGVEADKTAKPDAIISDGQNEVPAGLLAAAEVEADSVAYSEQVGAEPSEEGAPQTADVSAPPRPRPKTLTDESIVDLEAEEVEVAQVDVPEKVHFVGTSTPNPRPKPTPAKVFDDFTPTVVAVLPARPRMKPVRAIEAPVQEVTYVLPQPPLPRRKPRMAVDIEASSAGLRPSVGLSGSIGRRAVPEPRERPEIGSSAGG